MQRHCHRHMCLFLAFCFSATAQVAAADDLDSPLSLGNDSTLHFASTDQARKILTAVDDYVRRTSDFDRAARLKVGRAVAQEEYLQHVSDSVLPWTATETERLSDAFGPIVADLAKWNLPFPPSVVLVKTDGSEEGGAAYTRANAIVLPASQLANNDGFLARLLCHELFHVMSRHDDALRARLYDSIGFQPCNEIVLPNELIARKLTNPDAPRNDHFIELEIDGDLQPVIPVIFSRTEKYNESTQQPFFAYLQFELMALQRNAKTGKLTPLLIDGKAKLFRPKDVPDYLNKIGRNTGYIIHPEEVLADNFADLVMGRRDFPSPEVTMRIREILDEAGTRP